MRRIVREGSQFRVHTSNCYPVRSSSVQRCCRGAPASSAAAAAAFMPWQCYVIEAYVWLPPRQCAATGAELPGQWEFRIYIGISEDADYRFKNQHMLHLPHLRKDEFSGMSRVLRVIQTKRVGREAASRNVYIHDPQGKHTGRKTHRTTKTRTGQPHRAH